MSNSDNVSILVEVLKNNNITDFVISPGGTNIPVIRAVQDDPFFNCYSVVDERSAAYVAIGIYLQKKMPVALVCTSAQATRNYIPGLTEAFYKRVPILAITMEKHPRFKYQEYMQAPDQTSLPKDSVKESFELPFISDINDYYHSSRLVNEAVLELSRNGLGPVQLCVPWLDFPLEDLKPAIKTIRSFRANSVSTENLSNKKILVVIGEHTPFSKEEKKAIDSFCEKTNSVVYINHLSNFKNEYSVEGNLFLLTSNLSDIKEVSPDILISIGGQTGDYPFYLAFSRNNLEGIEHWRICDDGKVVDTYDKLTRVYQGSIVEFFNSVNSECLNHSFFELWDNKVSEMKTNLEVPFSQVSIAQYLHDKIPSNSILQFSILNSLRIWNMFSLDPSIECYSNVGAFGIDGGMSTLIGQSLASDKLSFMVIGDLAFFYDMNSLSIRQLKENVRILLVNNNGGIEFKLHGENKEETDRFIAAADYHGSAKGWAESCGFDYYAIHNMEELKEVTPNFVSKSKRPIIIEAFVTDSDESASYSKIINENTPKTAKDTVKQVIKGVLGEKSLQKMKAVFRGEK
ncbi:thiamine pyrophosphate-binding protein [Streptococcus equinus]|uniref:thiamine pyrophosphate-binding protein n=1 Tax=Streptococcus equinus TaxID=1335 RepID=UPI003BF80874